MPLAFRAALMAALLIPTLYACASGVIMMGAYAIDRGQWGHDPATSEWFRSLKNGHGTSCCDTTDGVRIDDPDWRENDDGTYSVFARGAWRTIDRDHVVTATNRVGYAVLWWPEHWNYPSCFLPGARG